MEKNMSNNLATQSDDNSNPQPDSVLQELAALLNAMRQTTVEEEPLAPQPATPAKPAVLNEPAAGFDLTASITDLDILHDLLEHYKDEPEIVQRLQQELLTHLR